MDSSEHLAHSVPIELRYFSQNGLIRMIHVKNAGNEEKKSRIFLRKLLPVFIWEGSYVCVGRGEEGVCLCRG